VRETTMNDLYTCPECEGFGEVRNWNLGPESVDDLRTCPTCLGEGTVGYPPDDGSDDGEPADIDGDAGFDPYAGGPESDGFDTYGDDCGCDDF
jgi:hypothetical protein